MSTFTPARSLVRCFSVSVLSGLLAGCGLPRDLPVNMRLDVSPAIRANFGLGLADYDVEVSRTGTIWLFASPNWGRSLACRRWLNGKWTETPPVHEAAAGQLIRQVDATIQTNDFPLVAWSIGRANEYPGRLPIWHGRWDGQGWTDRKQISDTEWASGITCEASQAGPVLLLCSRELDPVESYRVCFDAYFPYKPHCIIFAEEGPQGPQPIAQRSRWDYLDPFELTRSPDGSLHMVTSTYSSSFLDYGPSVIEHRTYKDGRWSGPDRVGDLGLFLEMVRPSLGMDSRGNLHLVYDVWYKTGAGPVPHRSRYRMKRGAFWIGPEPVGDDGYEAVIANDSAGRIYCFWKEGEASRVGVPQKAYIQAWDTDGRSEPTEVPMKSSSLARLIPGRDGFMYIAWQSDKWDTSGQIVIHKISLSETSGGEGDAGQ
ncbi:MAG: hypothetical protein ACYTF6_10220 [Planctomycetota bacterium]|jgi:hypothetical protein